MVKASLRVRNDPFSKMTCLLRSNRTNISFSILGESSFLFEPELMKSTLRDDVELKEDASFRGDEASFRDKVTRRLAGALDVFAWFEKTKSSVEEFKGGKDRLENSFSGWYKGVSELFKLSADMMGE